MKNLFILFAFFYGAVGFGQDNCSDNDLITRFLILMELDGPINYTGGFCNTTKNVTLNQEIGAMVINAGSIKMNDGFRSCCNCFSRLSAKSIAGPSPFEDTETKPIDKYEDITISAEDIGKPASYNWYDENGELVYEGKDYTIDSAIAKKYNLQVIDLVEGINSYKEVELIYKPNRLIAMFPNPANQFTTLNYKLNEADAAYIMVASYYGTNNATNVYMVNLETNETTIDVGNFNTGLYLVALVVNNNIADMKILSKN
jgi:hypothetical protein